MPRSLRFGIVLACVVLVALLPGVLAAREGPTGAPSDGQSDPPQQGASDVALAAQLRAASDGDVRISYHALTGRVRFVGASPAHPVVRPGTTPDSPDALARRHTDPVVAARAYVQAYGVLFGVRDQARELVHTRTRTTADGRTVLRFRQELHGLPVFGGELIVHLDTQLRLLVASGEVLPWEPPEPEPQITPEAAVGRAIEVVAKYCDTPPVRLAATAPELWLYNPVLVGARGPAVTRPVWRLEVYAAGQPVRELLLMDAASGAVALRFSLLRTGLDRRIYDNQNNGALSLPGPNLVRGEGAPPTGLTDADLAYEYAGDTYAFFAELGRDSIDGAGMTLISTVRYCPPPPGVCPYPNAFWNGEQMAYGQGMVADDVVAHEMTHGATEHEATLFYYMQSGAINEGFSDAFGEFVDLVNGSGDDGDAVRWLIGEDLPPNPSFAVPLRNMRDPPSLLHPDRITSPFYACGPQDYGGVHTNGGVMNKAVYLMTDGGEFNGHTVGALGIPKVSRILYEAMTDLLTSGADYDDLADALVQAAINLAGQYGITPADAEQVRRATLATEMHLQPSSCTAPEAPTCESGSVHVVFDDDLENPAGGNWQPGYNVGGNHWYYPQTNNPYPGWEMTYATSGRHNLWGDADFGGFWYGFAQSYGVSDSYLAMTHDVVVPQGAYLRFKHSYAFEAASGSYWDGGVLEYSVNQGRTWQDAAPLFTDNGYNGTLLPREVAGNPLGGRQAFAGESNGYISTRLSLASVAGQAVRFRFRIGTDESGGYYGWFVDDVAIYTCGPYVQPTLPPPPHTLHLALVTKGYIATGAEPLIREGFEGAFPAGWQVADDTPGHGEYRWAGRTCRAYSGGHSGWAVGGGSDGAALACGAAYPNNANSWMVYGPFSLADATEAAVDLKLWCNTHRADGASGGDHLSLMASVNGTDFRGLMLSGQSNGWLDRRLDLTQVYELGDLSGRPEVWFAVIFDSDEAVSLPEGAYVDDIVIWKAAGTPSTASSIPDTSFAAGASGPEVSPAGAETPGSLLVAAGTRTLPQPGIP